MGKILTKNDKEIIDFFNRIQDLKKILKSLKTDQLRSLQNEQYITDSELYPNTGVLEYYLIIKLVKKFFIKKVILKSY